MLQGGDVTDFFVELGVEWEEEAKELESMVHICKVRTKVGDEAADSFRIA